MLTSQRNLSGKIYSQSGDKSGWLFLLKKAVSGKIKFAFFEKCDIMNMCDLKHAV